MADFDYVCDATGETLTRSFRVGKAPKVVLHRGRRFRRSWSAGSTAKLGAVRTRGAPGKGLHFKAWSQGKVPPGEDPKKYGFERVDTDGVGLIDGEREMRNYIRVHNQNAEKVGGEQIRWLGDDPEWTPGALEKKKA